MVTGMRHGAVVVLLTIALSPAAPAGALPGGERAITYMGATYDRTDFRALNIGGAGWWFPQFDAPGPVESRPTGENAREPLPTWVRPLNHSTGPGDPGCDASAVTNGCLPTFAFRTFSQDGPARSKGGSATWNTFVLPDGTVGLSGAIVDPHTRENANNTINRIQLRDGVPSRFYFHVVVDNTNREHDPVRRLQARGNVGPLDLNVQVESDVSPGSGDLTFNGIADVHTFRFDGFVAGDYVKLRLQGGAGRNIEAGFGGLLFDDASFNVPPPSRARR